MAYIESNERLFSHTEWGMARQALEALMAGVTTLLSNRGDHEYARELEHVARAMLETRGPAVTQDPCSQVLQRARRHQEQLRQSRGGEVYRHWERLRVAAHQGFALANHMEEQAAHLRRELRETLHAAKYGDSDR
jgi:hypothetical protein